MVIQNPGYKDGASIGLYRNAQFTFMVDCGGLDLRFALTLTLLLISLDFSGSIIPETWWK